TVWVALETADRAIRRPDRPVPFAPILRPLALDALGWTGGAVVAAVGLLAGWRLAAICLLLLALLALEAARQALAAETHEQQAQDLERIGWAGRRMFAAGELKSVVQQIAVECARVLDYGWLQLELAPLGTPAKSWWARGGGAVLKASRSPRAIRRPSSASIAAGPGRSSSGAWRPSAPRSSTCASGAIRAGSTRRRSLSWIACCRRWRPRSSTLCSTARRARIRSRASPYGASSSGGSRRSTRARSTAAPRWRSSCATSTTSSGSTTPTATTSATAP